MKKRIYGGLVVLLAGLALVVTLTADAQTPGGTKGGKTSTKGPLEKVVANSTRLKEEDVQKVLKALAAALREKLQAGEAVDIPGLGTMRVVRVQEHKDIVTGQLARIPPVNYVEFVPNGDLAGAANAAGTVPNVVVPPAEFVINPRSAPSTRVENSRIRGTRIP